MTTTDHDIAAMTGELAGILFRMRELAGDERVPAMPWRPELRLATELINVPTVLTARIAEALRWAVEDATRIPPHRRAAELTLRTRDARADSRTIAHHVRQAEPA